MPTQGGDTGGGGGGGAGGSGAPGSSTSGITGTFSKSPRTIRVPAGQIVPLTGVAIASASAPCPGCVTAEDLGDIDYDPYSGHYDIDDSKYLHGFRGGGGGGGDAGVGGGFGTGFFHGGGAGGPSPYSGPPAPGRPGTPTGGGGPGTGGPPSQLGSTARSGLGGTSGPGGGAVVAGGGGIFDWIAALLSAFIAPPSDVPRQATLLTATDTGTSLLAGPMTRASAPPPSITGVVPQSGGGRIREQERHIIKKVPGSFDLPVEEELARRKRFPEYRQGPTFRSNRVR